MTRTPLWIIALAAVACSNPGGSVGPPHADLDPLPESGPIEVPEDLAHAAVIGYLFQGTDFVVTDDPASAPSDTFASPGTGVELIDIFGQRLDFTSTDQDGRFEFIGVPPGYHTVEVGRDTPEFAFAAPLTAFPETTVTMGAAYPITMDDATELALADVPDTAMVSRSLQPLSPGTIVYPDAGTKAGEGAQWSDAHQVTRDAWLLFVDLEPEARFAHPAQYVFVDAHDGEITRIDDVYWPPRVNHGRLWGSDVDQFIADGASPLAFDPDDLPEITVTPTDEIAQLPMTPRAATIAAPPDPATSHNTEADSVFVILVQGDAATDFTADTTRMHNFFLSQGVPPEQIAVFDAPRDPGAHFSRDGYRTAFDAFNAEIEARLYDTPARHSTLIVYITAHSGEQGVYQLHFQGRTQSSGRRADTLNLRASKACRIRVIADMCFAGAFANDLDRHLGRLPADQRSDLAVYATSSPTRSSRSTTWLGSQLWKFVGGTAAIGSWWVTEALRTMALQNGDLTGLLTPQDALIPGLSRMFQAPMVIVRRREPAWCDTLSGTWTGPYTMTGPHCENANDCSYANAGTMTWEITELPDGNLVATIELDGLQVRNDQTCDPMGPPESSGGTLSAVYDEAGDRSVVGEMTAGVCALTFSANVDADETQIVGTLGGSGQMGDFTLTRVP